jgi:hypothetical protein
MSALVFVGNDDNQNTSDLAGPNVRELALSTTCAFDEVRDLLWDAARFRGTAV